jgi:hypothetical protein
MSRFARSALLQQPAVGRAETVIEAAYGMFRAWKSPVLVRATRPVALPVMVPFVPLTSGSGIAFAMLVAVRAA